MATYIIAEYCSKCDKSFRHIGRGDPENCSVCGSKTELKTVEKYSVQDPNTKEEVVNITYKENPRYSVTLGVSENQIEEAKRLSPQVEWKRFGHSFRPLIKNRTDKLKLMKQCNYCEYDPKDFKGKQ